MGVFGTLKKYFLPDAFSSRWLLEMFASLVLPCVILIVKPLDLDFCQSCVVAGILLSVTWWSSGIVKRIPASIFLLLVFSLVSGVSLHKVFVFPLSESFPMIAITYLFSQAIANSGLIDIFFQPFLVKHVHTPLQCIFAIILSLAATIYIIPQPLARVIIVATVFSQFFKNADVPDNTRSTLMFTVFLMYAVVNMSALDADIIMNAVAASFAKTRITNAMWVRAMALPTIAVCVLIVLALVICFKRDLLGIRLHSGDIKSGAPMTVRQKCAVVIIAVTAVLWMTSGLHGINNTVITIIGTALLFPVGALHKEDWAAIDITTLIFLTAAFGIGGVMDSCGAADKVFGALKVLFPADYGYRYLFTMIFVCMVLHMMLGSNTTSLSIVVPGLMVLCGTVVPEQPIVYIGILSVSFHAFLPFHSVAMMIGEADGYFPVRYMLKMGMAETLILFFSAPCIFVPYWRLIGLL